MSGIIGSKINIRGSGRIAKLGTDGQVLTSGGAGVAANYEDIAAGISWQSVVTGSTLTAVAGNGYWVDTTSNTCTITLPASASNGDTIIFADFDRTWGTNKIILDSNGLNYQGDDDSFDVEYSTDGQAVKIVYSDATNGWIPIIDEAVEDAPSKGNSEGIFGYGESVPTGNVSLTNKVSNTGVVASDVTGVGTARGQYLGACEYGGDKGIFGYGAAPAVTAVTNLVTNAGVVGTDVTGVGTARSNLAACSYGGDKGIFGFGYASPTYHATTNLVSNTGVVGTDVSGVGTGRGWLAATEYGGDKGVFFAGNASGSANTSIKNLVSNTGVVATDASTTGVTGRSNMGACGYGFDKGIFSFGQGPTGVPDSCTNLVSNTGVFAADVTQVGSDRSTLTATQYGFDKGIMGFGQAGTPSQVNICNLVSNTGVVATDTSGVGTARKYLAACSFN
jgi:hypothetical protein